MKTPSGDKNWGREARRLWRDSISMFEFTPSELETLRIACHALTRLRKAEQELDRQGMTFTTTGGQVKQNPLCLIVKNERVGYLAAVRLLAIPAENQKELGRRPGDREADKWQERRLQSRGRN